MPIKIEQDGFMVKYMKRDENGNDVEVPIEEYKKASEELFSRRNPYKPIKNYYGKPIKEMILDIAKHIENDEVSNEVLVSFFQGHRIVFHNDGTGQLSSWWPEQLNSYDRAMFVCTVSCSCQCGPMNEPCNELGPGSKIDFTFHKKD